MFNQTIKKHFLLKLIIVVTFIALLYGCGFHLRGWNEGMPKFMQKVYIEYKGNDFSFLNTMSSAITSTGAKIVESPEDANLIVNIQNAGSSSRLIGITGGASSNQYMLTYMVSYQVLDNHYHIILNDQITTATQSYNTNATQQLSNNTQQQQLLSDLQSQVANNIVTQIQTISQTQYENAQQNATVDSPKEATDNANKSSKKSANE
ncbi:LPS assembly lipoprotein LptE [Fangia hongkongensis]|uniref:LPS-assembly lipoprotein LptE n=1 Tax=Fangia hongkongensis TaxID=270495 RepID=UPI00035F307C|nr:LPS assembly lipoprotein LptE [Fangia hongkongensis]MBK2126009.1 hypothetical protein [Fangia hongkongensis]